MENLNSDNPAPEKEADQEKDLTKFGQTAADLIIDVQASETERVEEELGQFNMMEAAELAPDDKERIDKSGETESAEDKQKAARREYILSQRNISICIRNIQDLLMLKRRAIECTGTDERYNPMRDIVYVTDPKTGEVSKKPAYNNPQYIVDMIYNDRLEDLRLGDRDSGLLDLKTVVERLDKIIAGIQEDLNALVARAGEIFDNNSADIQSATESLAQQRADFDSFLKDI